MEKSYFFTSLLLHLIGIVIISISYFIMPKEAKYTLNVNLVSLPTPVAPAKKPATVKPQPAPMERKTEQPVEKPMPATVTPKTIPLVTEKKQEKVVTPAPTARPKNNTVAPVSTPKELVESQPKAVSPNPQSVDTPKNNIKEQPKENTTLPDKPVELPKEVETVQKQPELPPKPAPLQINKNNDFNNFLTKSLTSLSEDNPVDILSEDSPLTGSEKVNFINQINQCWVNLGPVRDKTISVTLKLEMNNDATIANLKIIKDNDIPSSEWANIENSITNLFNNPKCSTLVLPVNKYSLWRVFTIKLNIKGFFE